MSADELFKLGRLQEAISAQIVEVKNHPADHATRLFLFELLAFAGDLDRAKRQIDAIDYDEPELVTAVLTYRKLLDAEQTRRRLFSESLQPKFLKEPPEHVKLRLEAVNRLREQQGKEAGALLEQAAAASPPFQGQLNDKPFTLLRDCDDLFGTVLEVMSQGNYYWVPLEHIESMVMNPPKFARDLLWIPAHLQVRDGPEGDVFLPALYPGSHAHADDLVKLGRMTDWKDANDFIAVHLSEMPMNGVYANLSAASRANPNSKTLATFEQLSFQGTTLRGLLLEAYGFSTFGQIALWAGIASFILAGLMLILVGFGLWHTRKVSADAELFEHRGEPVAAAA